MCKKQLGIRDAHSRWRRQLRLSIILHTILSLSQIYNFINGNHNSRNISESKEELQSGQILAVGCTKKTLKPHGENF